jgi:hypothetical protein
VFRADPREWERQDLNLSTVVAVLNLAGEIDLPSRMLFLRRVLTRERSLNMSVGRLSLTLYLFWLFQPVEMREAFLTTAVIERTRSECNDLLQKGLTARISLLGSAKLLGVEDFLESGESQRWPTSWMIADATMEAIGRFGGSGVSYQLASFTVGLQVVAACHPSRLWLPRRWGERLLALWERRHLAGNDVLRDQILKWLAQCRDGGWSLQRVDSGA